MKRTRERARFSAAAYADRRGVLPNTFPRIIGANAMKYLQEVVDSGLTVDMTGRFEKAFADAIGVKHCIASPGCTPALHMLAAAFEFGTLGTSLLATLRSLRAEILENQLHWYGAGSREVRDRVLREYAALNAPCEERWRLTLVGRPASGCSSSPEFSATA